MSSNKATTIARRGASAAARSSASRNPALVYLAGLQPTGRRGIYVSLKQIVRLDGDRATVETFDWAELRYEHVAAIRSRLIEQGLAPATINHAIAALRGVARAAWNLGLVSAEDYERIKHVPSVRGERLAPGRALDKGEVAALLDACSRDESPAGRRDAAIIALLFAAGLRRSEAATVRVEDYDPATGELRVIGKGDKQRAVWLTNGAVAAIEDWLEVRGLAPGPMLIGIYKSGRMRTSGEHAMRDTAIYDALQKRARQAKVSVEMIQASSSEAAVSSSARGATGRSQSGHWYSQIAVDTA
ncbi:MAG: tyrosine-type recombinase/integrase [Pseudomonadota bacterium]